MKNKNGFTLIELLAVIVVLAVIALIATPIVLNMVNTAKKGAAEASATTYIKAVEVEVLQKYMTEEKINDGDYYVGDLSDVKVKGTSPTNGIVSIKKGNVESAKLCIDNYSIDYDGTNYEISNNNYCKGEVILNINSKQMKKALAKEVEFDITGENISDITNIVCNNGTEVNVEENRVVVSKVLGDTICKANTSLKTTIEELDNTNNYIYMLKDEELHEKLVITSQKNVILNLNGKNLVVVNPDDLEEKNTQYSYDYYAFEIHGNLTINDKNNEGRIETPYSSEAIAPRKGSTVIINGGNYTGRRCVNNLHGTVIINDGIFSSKDYEAVYNHSNSTTTINNGEFLSKNRVLYNDSGVFDINGGIYISEVNRVIDNVNTGIINITQTEKPIYIGTLAQSDKIVVLNTDSARINISANIANECMSDSQKTTSGLCIYAGGNKNEIIRNTSSQNVNIDGGTYYGTYKSINNTSSGTINICSGTIDGLQYDLYNQATGYIKYKSNVSLKNNAIYDTNTPSHVVLDDTIICR